MKRILLTISIGCLSYFVLAQKSYDLYEFKSQRFDSCNISFDYHTNKFKIFKKPIVGFDIVAMEAPFSKGYFKADQTILKCFDKRKKRWYIFKQSNDSTLISLKNTEVIFKGEKLKKIYSE